MPRPFAYPAFQEAASRSSVRSRRQYLRAVGLRQVALVVAAVGGAVGVGSAPGGAVFAWIAFVGFAAAILGELFLTVARPDRVWRETRAVSESLKSSAWRFAVCGLPFPEHLTAAEARRRLVESLSPGDQAGIPSELTLVPDDLVACRDRPLAERRSIYREDRVRYQIGWYRERSRRCAAAARGFQLATIVLEFLGLVAAAIRLTTDVPVDGLGILAAVVAGLTTWTQTVRFAGRSDEYTAAARRLIELDEDLATCAPEDWAESVDRTESVLAREVASWHAARVIQDG